MTHSSVQKEKGFALLFTVLVVSILLAISLSISNITLRELILSSATRDSHTAFYAADTAFECALYADAKVTNVFALAPGQTVLTQMPACGLITSTIGTKTQVSNPVVSPYCFTFSVDKIPASGGASAKTVIETRGYNTCTNSTRRVERGIRFSYLTPSS